MNSTFTPDDIALAGRLAKVAMALEQAQDPAALAMSLQGPASYATWLNPPKIVKPAPYQGPGFWSSFGRSALGTLDRLGGANVRSLVGLSPGPSGISYAAKPLARSAWSAVTGDWGSARQHLNAARQGLSAATSQARWQSAPYDRALASWATEQHPTATRRLTMPWHTFKTWWNEPDVVPKFAPTEPRPDPWKPAYLPPIKTTPAP